MSSVMVGFETDGADAVDGAGVSPAVVVPDSLLDVLGGVAAERGLSVGELWDSFCALERVVKWQQVRFVGCSRDTG